MKIEIFLLILSGLIGHLHGQLLNLNLGTQTQTPTVTTTTTCTPPCGQNSVCTLGACICINGYALDPTTKTCVTKCELLKCPKNETCIPSTSIITTVTDLIDLTTRDKCICKPGFIRNSTGSCVDPCDTIKCTNGMCMLIPNKGPICICPNGYQYSIVEYGVCVKLIPPGCIKNIKDCNENSFKEILCIDKIIGISVECIPPPKCNTTCDCNQKLNQTCVNGECINLCAGVTCPVNNTCDPKDGKCKGNTDICSASCGFYANCTIGPNGTPNCTCPPGFLGSPPNCRPGCYLNCSCPFNQTCINMTCQNPCTPGYCKDGKICVVINHQPCCKIPDPCRDPYPCGPNSYCKNVNGKAVCSCSQNHIGTPPNCKLECVKDCDCSSDYNCINGKCVKQDPCEKCGPNSRCDVIDGYAICSCLDGMYGEPPNCNSQCTCNEDCPNSCRCEYGQCMDVCGDCGPNTDCEFYNHQVTCKCKSGYQGDVYAGCTWISPCDPSPCGPNAHCAVEHNEAVCTCLDGTYGDPPYCRTQCIFDEDCCKYGSKGSKCIHGKCIKFSRNPCNPNPCGPNAECQVIGGEATCECSIGCIGNPYSSQGCYFDKPRKPKCNGEGCRGGSRRDYDYYNDDDYELSEPFVRHYEDL